MLPIWQSLLAAASEAVAITPPVMARKPHCFVFN
jgi:hypothetical protein